MGATASLFGWIGFVFILFGLIGVVIQIFSGGLFWSRDQLWVWGNLVVGALLLAAGLLGNLEGLRERLRRSCFVIAIIRTTGISETALPDL